jgi:hypothetical protein
MNGDEYAQGATERDAGYRTAYATWVAGLSPEDRKTLERRKLLAPDLGTSLGGAAAADRSRDAAEAPEASVTVDMALLFDTVPDFLREKMGLTLGQAVLVSEWHGSIVKVHGVAYQAWLVGKLVAGLLNAENVRLAAGGLAFATNLDGLNGMSTMTAWARKTNLSRAAVSKTTKWWQRELKMVRSVHMKSARACTNYSRAAVAAEPRKRACPPTFCFSYAHNYNN